MVLRLRVMLAKGDVQMLLVVAQTATVQMKRLVPRPAKQQRMAVADSSQIQRIPVVLAVETQWVAVYTAVQAIELATEVDTLPTVGDALGAAHTRQIATAHDKNSVSHWVVDVILQGKENAVAAAEPEVLAAHVTVETMRKAREHGTTWVSRLAGDENIAAAAEAVCGEGLAAAGMLG